MAIGDAGDVTIGQRTYRVTTIGETVKRTTYFVQLPGVRPRAWRAAPVSVGAESVFVCHKCQRHSGRPCVHINVVLKYVAAQPREAVPVGES